AIRMRVLWSAYDVNMRKSNSQSLLNTPTRKIISLFDVFIISSYELYSLQVLKKLPYLNTSQALAIPSIYSC
ncbi:hypothetical protein, partial [Vibrio campbellii]|uniref:hypothetical protein n=1 Tax=Vibrio campbellii TaxID=680 RepID=UPI001BDAC2B5